MTERNYKVHAKMVKPKLAESSDDEPLRLSHLMEFLTTAKRSTTCPHCNYRGPWEISLQLEEGEDSENPRLTIYMDHVISGGYHTSSGMTCANCGHFAQISTYKIRQFLAQQEGSNER